MKKILLILFGFGLAVAVFFMFYLVGDSDLKNEELQAQLDAQKDIPKQGSEKPLIQLNLERYFGGVAQIGCNDSEGSGSLWKLSNGEYAVLTNYHVIEDSVKTDGEEFCFVYAEGFLNKKGGGIFKIYPEEDYLIEGNQDIALLPIRSYDLPGSLENGDINKLNYSISTLPNCPLKASVGSPVYIIGYPASGSLEIEYAPGRTATQDFRIVTEGIISGHDTSIANSSGNRDIPDFFVSAKIDAGNSGGIALSEEGENICILGVPTWVNVGEYDTQGIIQNINSIII